MGLKFSQIKWRFKLGIKQSNIIWINNSRTARPTYILILHCTFDFLEQFTVRCIYYFFFQKKCWQPRGYSSFVFCKDVPPQNLKVDSFKIPIFKEKVTHSYTNQLNFGPNFEQNYLIFPGQPIHIPNSASYKGSFIYQVADFSTHVGGTSL